MTMTSASNALLVDTNILVYLHDARDRDKQFIARSVLEAAISQRRATLSVQCLTEFFRVVTRRLPEPLMAADALLQVERLIGACWILDLTPAVVAEACRGAMRYQLSIWDALIWAAAKLYQVPYVLTEDAEHGRLLEGVRFANPFDRRFEATTLGLA